MFKLVMVFLVMAAGMSEPKPMATWTSNKSYDTEESCKADAPIKAQEIAPKIAEVAGQMGVKPVAIAVSCKKDEKTDDGSI